MKRMIIASIPEYVETTEDRFDYFEFTNDIKVIYVDYDNQKLDEVITYVDSLKDLGYINSDIEVINNIKKCKLLDEYVEVAVSYWEPENSVIYIDVPEWLYILSDKEDMIVEELEFDNQEDPVSVRFDYPYPTSLTEFIEELAMPTLQDR